MVQAALITLGDQKINQLICNELLEKGYSVLMQFNSQKNADEYMNSLLESWRNQFRTVVNTMDDSERFQQVVEQCIQTLGGLQLLIHGNEWINEDSMYESDTTSLSEYMDKQFKKLFLWNHYVGIHMAKQRQGKIIFPLLNDTLYYSDYPSSPILNHGKLAMMKCLARELNPFDIQVNAITFGYYDHVEDRVAKKALKKQLEIYTLKPSLPKMEQMISTIHVLLQGASISGQNIQIGAGTETFI